MHPLAPNHALSRRRTLRLIGASASMAALSALPARLAYAATDRRLVIIVLRGALDGLAAVPAYADPDYRRQRGGRRHQSERHGEDCRQSCQPCHVAL